MSSTKVNPKPMAIPPALAKPVNKNQVKTALKGMIAKIPSQIKNSQPY